MREQIKGEHEAIRGQIEEQRRLHADNVRLNSENITLREKVERQERYMKKKLLGGKKSSSSSSTLNVDEGENVRAGGERFLASTSAKGVVIAMDDKENAMPNKPRNTLKPKKLSVRRTVQVASRVDSGCLRR
jgi:hypothetical protein